MNNEQLLSCYEVMTYLEKIGDKIKRLDRTMKGKNLLPQHFNTIEAIQKNLYEKYEQTMTAFWKKDKPLAEEIIISVKSVINEIIEFQHENPSLELSICCEFLREMATLIKNIAISVITFKFET